MRSFNSCVHVRIFRKFHIPTVECVASGRADNRKTKCPPHQVSVQNSVPHICPDSHTDCEPNKMQALETTESEFRFAQQPVNADRLSNRAKSREIFTQPASRSDIFTLFNMAREKIGEEIASAETGWRIQQLNPLSIWSVYGRKGLLGGGALLFLNNIGIYKLICGELDLSKPPSECICGANEKPAAIYCWAIVLSGNGILGIADVMRFLQSERFSDVDIWTNPVTAQGASLVRRLGFTKAKFGGRVLFKFKR